MKTNPVVLLFGVLTSLAPVHAGECVDHFDRQDVAATANGADIGPDWVIGSGEWTLHGNRIRVNTNFEAMALNAVMWNTALPLRNGDFTVSLTRFRATNPRSSGLAFLVQDADSYHAFRLGSAEGVSGRWEFIENDNGDVAVLQDGDATGPWDSTTPYAITVSSTAPDSLTFKVVNLESTETVVDTTITQPGLPDTGFAGPYYEHMNLLHLSYAAFDVDNEDPEHQYIRGRRYMPPEAPMGKANELSPDYFPQGLFKTGMPHHITVIKRAGNLHFKIENAEQSFYGVLGNPDLPDLTEPGRIGFRHMATRSARYKNISVYRLEEGE